MKKPILPAVVIFVSLFAFSLLAPSVSYGQPSRVGKSGKGPETYMVIMIDDENKTTDPTKTSVNKIEFKVVSSSQYTEEEKQVRKKNEDNLNEWRDLIKTDPQAPRPVKITIKKMKTGYKTQKIAQEYADKLKDEQANKDSGAGPKAPAKQ